MVTLSRAGNAVIIRDNGREIAVVRPADGNAFVTASLAAAILALIIGFNPDKIPSPLWAIPVLVIAVTAAVYGVFSRTRIEVTREAILTREVCFGVTFHKRTFPLDGVRYVRREERTESVKGTDVVRHYLIIGGEFPAERLDVSIDRAGGDAVVEMLERERAYVSRPEEVVSDTVLARRVRNRRIEVLELTSSFEDQRQYQRVAPVNVANEVINQWDDWTFDGVDTTFDLEVYTQEEIDSLLAYQHTFNRVCAATAHALPDLDETQQLPAWKELRFAAECALAVMMKRGKLSED